MRHQPLEQLQILAEVNHQRPHMPMTRIERLARWAELLEQHPERRLWTLPGTEYSSVERRRTMRAPDSPMTVAFECRRLRAEGMRDDSYGEAKRFFELTDRQLHRIVCYCHFGETVAAGNAARSVRLAMVSHRSLFSRLREALF